MGTNSSRSRQEANIPAHSPFRSSVSRVSSDPMQNLPSAPARRALRTVAEYSHLSRRRKGHVPVSTHFLAIVKLTLRLPRFAVQSWHCHSRRSAIAAVMTCTCATRNSFRFRRGGTNRRDQHHTESLRGAHMLADRDQSRRATSFTRNCRYRRPFRPYCKVLAAIYCHRRQYSLSGSDLLYLRNSLPESCEPRTGKSG